MYAYATCGLKMPETTFRQWTKGFKSRTPGKPDTPPQFLSVLYGRTENVRRRKSLDVEERNEKVSFENTVLHMLVKFSLSRFQTVTQSGFYLPCPMSTDHH